MLKAVVADLWRFDSAGIQCPNNGTEPGSTGTPAGIGMLPNAWRQCVSTVITSIAARIAHTTGRTSTTELLLAVPDETDENNARKAYNPSATTSDTPPILRGASKQSRVRYRSYSADRAAAFVPSETLLT